jgi:hypothetical protein
MDFANLNCSTRSKPHLAFLIPIASSRRIRNWHIACAYFEQTLSSIFNSAHGDYCVVAAGHEPPNFELPKNTRFEFLSLDHPLPSLENGYYRAAVKDKLIKLGAAWKHAKSTWNPEYVMKLDWDDLVSSRLVEWLENASGEAGYLIQHGWVWRSGSRYLIQRTEHFDRHCGSSLIIRSDLADKTGPFLSEIEGAVLDEAGCRFAANDHYSLLPGSGTTTLLLNDSHQRYAAQFGYLGHKLATVPFNAAVCRIHENNAGADESLGGESLRMFLGRVRRTRWITPSLKKEFMLG